MFVVFAFPIIMRMRFAMIVVVVVGCLLNCSVVMVGNKAMQKRSRVG